MFDIELNVDAFDVALNALCTLNQVEFVLLRNSYTDFSCFSAPDKRGY